MARLSQRLGIDTAVSYDSGSITASAFVDVNHGLGATPASVSLQRQVGADWEDLDVGNYLLVNGTQIKDAGLTSLGADVVRIRASTSVGLYQQLASATESGQVSTGAQTFAGDKTFTGSVTAGTLTDGTASFTAGALTGATTLTASGNITSTGGDIFAGRGLFNKTADWGIEVQSSINNLIRLKRSDGAVLGTIQTNTDDILTTGSWDFDSGTLHVDGSNNRVGVGTATPEVALDVRGPGNFGGFIPTANNEGAVAARIESGDNYALGLFRQGAAAGWGINVTNTTESTLEFNKVGEGASLGTKMVIQADGNVGIGTTSPTDGPLTVAAPSLGLASPGVVVRGSGQGAYTAISAIEVRASGSGRQIGFGRSGDAVGYGTLKADGNGITLSSTTSTPASEASYTERFRITHGGSGYFPTSMYIGAISGTNEFSTVSNAGSSTTMYIGNAAIQVSSDARLKTNVQDSQLDALSAISSLRLVDFDWNDPSDTASVNKNSRGRWTGVLAQEAVLHVPTMVNAPRKEDGSLDFESENTWHLDTGAAIGILLKAVQELKAEIEALKNP
jgi:hypothetical protein